MRLGVVVALWGREGIAQVSLTRYARAARGHDVTLVAVTDEPGNGSMADELGYEVVAAPNFPVSDKHNAGAAHLRGRVDAMVVLGSDNWVCDRLFGAWERELESSPIVGVTDVWHVCVHRPDALYWRGYTNHRAGESIGVARALRSDVLDALDWQPWGLGANKGLDSTMTARLRERGYSTAGKKQAELGVRVIGLKSTSGLTPFEKFSRTPGAVPVDRAMALQPFDEVERDALARLCTY